MNHRTAMAAFAALVIAGRTSAGTGDWLLDPSPYKAEIKIGEDRIVLSNGLVSREVLTRPEASTVSIKCTATGEEFVRSLGPEAWVTIDGERYSVGGIEGAPLENYFRPAWIPDMKPASGAYRYRSCRMEEVEKPLEWKKRPEWLSDDLPWPPKGRRIVMTYAPPEGGKGADLGEVALEQKFLETWGSDWREILWTTTNRTSCCNEGKPGEIFTQAGTYAYLEHDWPEGAYYLSAVVSANVDSDRFCWGPAIAVDLPGREGKMHSLSVFPRAAAREYEAGPDGTGTFFGLFDPAKPALLELFRQNGYWIARASQKGAAPASFSIPDEYGAPVKFRVGKLGYRRAGLLLPKGKDRVHCPNPPGEWTLSHLHEVTCRLPPSAGGGKSAETASLPDVEIAYEIYDGVPAMSKSIKIVNGTTNSVIVDSFASECVKLVERPYMDQRGPAHFNIHVESDYSVDCAGRIHGDENRNVRFLPDPNYGTQIDFKRTSQALLEVGPAVGPAQIVKPGETFDGIRAYELVFDSTDKTRRELTFCRFYRTLVPWAMENPLVFHCTDSSFAGLSNGVEQCAAAGFDICTASFRCGFDMENTDPVYIDATAAVSRYARLKGVALGAYSLTTCRNAYRPEDQVVNPPDGAPFPRRCYPVSPCLCSESGMDMMNRFQTFIEKGELGFWENDGPYSGDVCCATNHPGHRGAMDSEWNQMQVQKRLYNRCRELGVYVNQPAWLFFHGGSCEGIGYSEQHWSLPREEQVLIERQNIYKGTWVKPIQMSWGFIPLCTYHGGGDAAVLEPLEKNLATYDRRMANVIGAGLKCIQRGTRLYDTPKTLAMLKKWTDFRRRHRRVLDGDFIHLRCADGRDWDGWLKVRATGDERALAFIFNPLDDDIVRTIRFPLYYAGLPDEMRTVSIPANGYATVEFRAGGTCLKSK